MTARYVETAPLVYTSVETPPSIFGKLVFRADAQGNVTHLFQENNPTSAYVKAPWYGAGGFNLTLLLLCLLLFLITLIGGLVALWFRWRYREARSWLAQLAAWSAGLLSLAAVAFVVIFGATVSDLETLILGLPAWFAYAMLLPWAVAVLTVVMLLLTPVVWARRHWSLPRRLHYMLLLVGGGAFVWWLYYWNLLVWPG
jgi:hypothetical protein